MNGKIRCLSLLRLAIIKRGYKHVMLELPRDHDVNDINEAEKVYRETACRKCKLLARCIVDGFKELEVDSFVDDNDAQSYGIYCDNAICSGKPEEITWEWK